MKYFFLLLFMSINLSVSAQSAFDTSVDKENQSIVFKGRFTFDDLLKESSFTWMKEGANAYKPDAQSLAFLKEHLFKYHIVIAMGTWCSDSQALIPQIYQLLLLAHFPMNQYALFGVDRAKESKNEEHKKYEISLVPTIILFRDEKEIGRITEQVQKSIEADLASIISKDIR